MRSKRTGRFLKSECGAVSVVEAALVYPIVILTVAAMIYIGIYMYETALLKDKAQSTAVQAARSISFAGYDEFTVYTEGDTEEISYAQISHAYEESKPYRYIVTGDVNSSFQKNASDFAAGLIINSESADCDIEVKKHLLNREVVVKIRKKIAMPQMFSLLGLDHDYGINVSASALTSDPAEFIRNTDLTVNTVTFLSEKFHLDEKLAPLREKIAGLLKRFGIGEKNEE